MAQALLNTARYDAPLHVLVADDSEVSRALIRRLLTRNGYIAHEAEDGQKRAARRRAVSAGSLAARSQASRHRRLHGARLSEGEVRSDPAADHHGER